jgi:glucokinase
MNGITTLCADLGGSRVKLAVVEDGRIAASEMFAVGANTAETLAAVVEKGRGLMCRAGGSFAGIAVAAPGIVDEETRRVVVCNGKYAGLEDIDLTAWARREFNLDLRIVNDARAALMGELAYGCAMGETDAVMVILGTGVGTSAVSGGRIVRGRHFTHGLLGGHLPVSFDGDRRCTCGAMNCLEAYVGSWALKEMAGDPEYDYRRLECDYAAGSEKAKRLFATISTALGAGTVALVHAFDPEAVIWSGGVSRFASLIDAVQGYVHENAWTPWGKIRFLKAADPEASVTLGLHSLFADKE